MNCPKCKCSVFIPRYAHNPNQIAAHCSDCGAFIKWLNKDERMLLKLKQQQEYNNFCMQYKAKQELDYKFAFQDEKKIL